MNPRIHYLEGSDRGITYIITKYGDKFCKSKTRSYKYVRVKGGIMINCYKDAWAEIIKDEHVKMTHRRSLIETKTIWRITI